MSGSAPRWRRAVRRFARCWREVCDTANAWPYGAWRTREWMPVWRGYRRDVSGQGGRPAAPSSTGTSGRCPTSICRHVRGHVAMRCRARIRRSERVPRRAARTECSRSRARAAGHTAPIGCPRAIATRGSGRAFVDARPGPLRAPRTGASIAGRPNITPLVSSVPVAWFENDHRRLGRPSAGMDLDVWIDRPSAATADRVPARRKSVRAPGAAVGQPSERPRSGPP